MSSLQPAPSPPTSPRYIYKILPAAPPHPLPAALPLSELDASDAYIHLSTSDQVSRTCARFFASHTHIWLLQILLETVQRDIKWESSGGGVFPHLYGQDLGAGNVDKVLHFGRDSAQDWDDAFLRAGFQ